MDTEAKTDCPRCNKKFECRPNDISACNCTQIELSKEEYKFINAKYTRCLCNACIMELKNEYAMNYQYNYNNPDNAVNRRSLLLFVLGLFFCGIGVAQPY